MNTGAQVLADIQDEIEPAGEAVACIRYPHQQFALEKTVARVRWFVGKIELRGQETAARRLDFDVIVPRAARVDGGHNSSKAVCAVGSGDEMAAISKTDVVVFALLVRVPQIDHCSEKRAAASGQHKAGKFSRAGLSAWLAQVTALGRFWFEKRSVTLACRWFIAVATGRRGRKLLRKSSVCTGEFPARGNDAGVQ